MTFSSIRISITADERGENLNQMNFLMHNQIQLANAEINGLSQSLREVQAERDRLKR